MLVAELDAATTAVNQDKPKAAYTLIALFDIEVNLLVFTRVLTHAQGNPLTGGADRLLRSLKIGGGF